MISTGITSQPGNQGNWDIWKQQQLPATAVPPACLSSCCCPGPLVTLLIISVFVCFDVQRPKLKALKGADLKSKSSTLSKNLTLKSLSIPSN